MDKSFSVRLLQPREPKFVTCPFCGFKQPFVKETQYWKIVKAPHLKKPLLLRIRMLCAKCQNPQCRHKSFALPLKDIERYQRATRQLMVEAVAGVVRDNSTLQRIAQRLARSLNTTGSKSTLDRWKNKIAAEYDFPQIISQLQFSGALSIDEYMPRRGGRFEQIAGDALKVRLLYLEPVPWFYGRGVTTRFLEKLSSFGLCPYCVIFDLWTTFIKVVHHVWPEALLQYDHFHVTKWLWHYLKNALIQFRDDSDDLVHRELV